MSDPNVIYGGDFEKSSELNYPSMGALIIDKLKNGKSGKVYVSILWKMFTFWDKFA